MIAFSQRHPARRAHELYRSERDGQTCAGGIGRFDDSRIAEVVVGSAKVGPAAETSNRGGRPSGYTRKRVTRWLRL
jgi:hypothetical protein